MKIGNAAKIFLILFLYGALTFPQEKYNHTLFQSSPFTGLLNGVMNDNFTIGELSRYGNFGLGTFNGVDGEMIVLDGKVYRIDNRGKVSLPNKSEKTPFATLTFFHADTAITLNKEMNFKQFNEFLNGILPSENLIYAIKISGNFISVKARSEGKQTEPYSNLADVLKNQSIFDLTNVKGTLVGFKFPNYLNGVNVPGYHFHFLTADKKSGGHALDFTTGNVKVEIEFINKLDVNLPGSKDFLNTSFDKKDSAD